MKQELEKIKDEILRPVAYWGNEEIEIVEKKLKEFEQQAKKEVFDDLFKAGIFHRECFEETNTLCLECKVYEKLKKKHLEKV